MAESKATVIVPLKGENYATWKVQCRMALVRDGLWGIVSGTETVPDPGQERQKFLARRDRALATIVLAVDPSLLYLLGDPEDPVAVWKKLQNQFQKKTWANKLALRRRLHALVLKDGESVQDHVKTMTELFNELAIVGGAIEDEDQVVYLLASLPDSFNTLVTALEASEAVPQMEVVIERLLHTERKQKEKSSSDPSAEKAMTTKRQFKGRGPQCGYCKRYGHIQKNCYDRIKVEETKAKQETGKGKRFKSNKVGLVACHALGVQDSTDDWIVDSGATCHICNSEALFDELEPLSKPQKVTLGDGRTLEAMGVGAVEVKLNLPDGKSRVGRLSEVLFVPTLAYNLLSVAKATEAGKMVKFGETQGHVIDDRGEVVAVASRNGSLYYLRCEPLRSEQVNSASLIANEELWHRRFGHLGERSLCKLKKDELVHGFNYDTSKKAEFCESCVSGKIHRSPFPKDGRERAKEPLGLIHSDVCGKINTKSLGHAEYFVSFVDDQTHYTWIYAIKHKHEVFQTFVEWKRVVEKSSGHRVKKLRTDNGGEYTSAEFESYLKKEGIEHQFTIPKTPEQNGVSERLNRTLVETIRCMLADSRLPHKFWAEALSTAAYLLNRSPTKALHNKTPFEAWFGKQPNVNHLRVFGCSAYVHIPKDERKKLDPKAKKCIFLGYGALRKGYRLYDRKTSRILHSRDVVFNELSRGYDSEGEKQLIEVEGFSEEPEEVPEQEARESVAEADGDPHGVEPNGDETEEDPVSEEEEPEDVPVPVPVPVPRRSTRENQNQKPNYLGDWVFTAAGLQKEPQTVEEAMGSAEKEWWKAAMQKEMESIYSNDVWDLVELPNNRRPVGCKWVFKRKTKANGSIERYKARLVARGFSQKQGLDYDETFSPVIRFESFRSLVAVAVQKGLKLHQLDITAAFLNGHLEEEVFMDQPEGFKVEGKEHLVCRLKQSLYGLKQSPRCWNSTLDAHLKSMGYVQSTSDPCIYTSTEGETSIIGVYVDDFVIATESSERIEQVKAALSQKFDVKDLGSLHYFLGVQVKQDEKGTWIGQPTFTESILQKYGMSDAKPVKTPVSVNSKLLNASEESELVDQSLYQSAVGSLLYLATRTRPDISFAVNNVARYCSKPTKSHWTAVKRIFRYLRGTTHHGLLYSKGSESHDLIGYSDADWGGDDNDYKSTTGYLFQIGGTAITWKSKKQSCVALSTAEAEYMALSSAAQEAIWIRELNADLWNCQSQPTLIYEDNQSAISMAKNPQFHGRSKHINIKYHFVREQVSNDKICLEYCPTENMIADILTKGIGPEKFERLRSLCGVCHHVSCEKEC